MDELPKVDGVEFRLIAGFKNYVVGDDGTVWIRKTKRRWEQVKTWDTNKSWRTVLVDSHGVRHRMTLNRIVLTAFGGEELLKSPKHIDGDTSNNRADNLRWGDCKRKFYA